MADPRHHSAVVDIGPNVLHLDERTVEALLGRIEYTDDLRATQLDLVGDVADYLSQARILARVHDPRTGHDEDVLTDGTWSWTRRSAYFTRAFGVVDVRLFAHAWSKGLILAPEDTNPDWRPMARRTLEDEPREEHRTWRD